MVFVFDGMMGGRSGGHSVLMVLWGILSRVDSSAQRRKEQIETCLGKELLYELILKLPAEQSSKMSRESHWAKVIVSWQNRAVTGDLD